MDHNEMAEHPHCLRGAEMPPEVAASAARMDALIAAFAIGVLLGMMIRGVGA